MKLDPRTIASIQLNPPTPREDLVDYACGCFREEGANASWWLCQYHLGYEDACEARTIDLSDFQPAMIGERIYALVRGCDCEAAVADECACENSEWFVLHDPDDSWWGDDDEDGEP